MTTPRKKLSNKEKAWAWRHAKEHIVEALKEVLTEEHHSHIEIDGVVRNDVHSEVMRNLEYFLKLVRKTRSVKK